MNDCWMFKGDCLKRQPDAGYGFIYVITDDQGKKYYGKKAFIHKKKTTLSKRTRAKLKTRARYRISYEDSKWLDYWGSCKPLLEYIKERGGTHGFKREIITICANRSSLAYWEVATLIENKVLFREDCWNGNVCAKYFKGKIHDLLPL